VKDPALVRAGRLGGLTVAARGRVNTAPARAARLARLAERYGIPPDLDPVERDRRMRAALRAEMTKVAAARWRRQGAAAPAAEEA
jgi:hypothetical protein